MAISSSAVHLMLCLRIKALKGGFIASALF